GRGRAVGKYMAQMGVADVAKDLGTHHAMAGVRFFAYVFGVERLEIAGPATTGIEFGIRGEEGGLAAYTAIDAWAEGIPVATGARAVSPFATGDVGLFGRRLGRPLFF